MITILSGGRASGKTYYAIKELTDENTLVIGYHSESLKYFKEINEKVKCIHRNTKCLLTKIIYEIQPKRIILDEFSFNKDLSFLYQLKEYGFDVIITLGNKHVINTYRNEKIYINE